LLHHSKRTAETFGRVGLAEMRHQISEITARRGINNLAELSDDRGHHPLLGLALPVVQFAIFLVLPVQSDNVATALTGVERHRQARLRTVLPIIFEWPIIPFA
jgi:hypothetical protein